jgi:hypothetical protein
MGCGFGNQQRRSDGVAVEAIREGNLAFEDAEPREGMSAFDGDEGTDLDL